MSARVDPAAGPDLAREMVADVVARLDRWLRAEGKVPTAAQGQEAAELLTLNFLLVLAHERRGADGVMDQMWRAYQSGFAVMARHGQLPPKLEQMASSFGVRP
ncbi:MAG: hypothetical protein LKG39_06580 [Acetobacter sp.]|uniref:hypothetical protein n=2 Tax=Acetobacter sp. TaxID=440 RepID=UPI0025C5374B|nr:hypothetical protein [Acetobacter sp.]MCI1316064.1 hypothetical protein [Acetobacter sp.]